MTTSYPLRQIEIDGFRGFRNFALPDLGGVNVLVGGNNSGKTSVLEAVALVCEPCNPRNWAAIIHRRDPGRIDESPLRSLGFAFHRAGPVDDEDALLDVQCDFRCEGDFGLKQLRVSFREFYGEPSDDELNRVSGKNADLKKYFAGMARSDRGMRAAEVLHEPSWHDVSQYADEQRSELHDGYSLAVWEGLPFSTMAQPKNRVHLEHAALAPYSYQDNSVQVSILSRQKLGGDSQSVVELLQDFDGDIEAIEIASLGGHRPSIYLRHRRLGMMPLSAFGDAVRRSVLLASKLSALNAGSILLIDEAEAGIHTEAQQKFFSWLIRAARQRQIQVFLTTHSLETVDALLSAMPDDAEEEALVVYRLEKHPNGASHKRFAGDLLRRIRFDRGWDVR
jgi:energy-coupling factor transporter ATP-binding protein EcfA2